MFQSNFAAEQPGAKTQASRVTCAPPEARVGLRMDITIIYMAVVLKIPILLMLGIVWWAIRSTPDEEAAVDGEGGQKTPAAPIRPRGRGPHGEPQPQPPRRIRTGARRAPLRRS